MKRNDQDLKTLCDIISPENPDDDPNETQYHYSVDNSEQYNLLQIHTYFGNINFKEIFLLYINDIKNQLLSNQRTLCLKLLDRLKVDYEYEFPDNIPLINQNDINIFYDFISFFEFDNVKFLSMVWSTFRIKNLLKLNIRNFIFSNKETVDKLLEQITNNSLLYESNSLINKFLNSAMKNVLIKWFIKKSIINKINITIKLNEGENND